MHCGGAESSNSPGTSPSRPAVDRRDLERFLAEDVGPGDLTAALVPETARAVAEVVTREDMVLCGQDWFEGIFLLLDPEIRVEWFYQDASTVPSGERICRIRGMARALLTGERTALNLLQTLSGTATLARRYAEAVAGTGVRVLDTRKTLPGLRQAQKYAVCCGGCHNHRMGLYDAILIKENHILAAGSIAQAVQAARQRAAGVSIEVEVENLGELEQALAAGVDRVLLDNFSLAMLREAVARVTGRIEVEASGNIDLDNIRAVAETGVDFISVGSLTKHVRAVDLSLRIAFAD
ncbi:MAG TPA: carboxylating nicotinate-nucleotide diphosphorylase [Methylococcus sp.]|nr:carboxylating nicotinate-nucleotide diphosphorylase [Methylococcus sp.]